MSNQFLVGDQMLTEDEMIVDAQRIGISLEEYKKYVNAQPSEGKVEQTDPFLKNVKIPGPAEKAALVGPQSQEQLDTELPSEDTSLVLPQPKKQNEIFQIKETDLGNKEEEAEAELKKWFANQGLANDFKVITPVNPFAEKIRITSNQTGEEFDYNISGFTGGAAQGRGMAFESAPRTSINELNNWLYANSRHDKTNTQNFYKKTGVPFSEAKFTTNEPDLFDESTYLNNSSIAQAEAESYINKLLSTNKYKKYSVSDLQKDPAKRKEYVENIYEDLEDNNKLDEGALVYFNKDGKKNILNKVFDKSIAKKAAEESEQENINALEYLQNNNIPEDKAQQAYFDITKKTYVASADENTKNLIALKSAINSLQEKLAATENPLEQAAIKSQIDNLNEQRKKIDKDFVPLANIYTGKIAKVKPDNIDSTNQDVVDISSMVSAYKDVFNAGKPERNVLQLKASEVGKELAANDVLGNKTIPYVKVDLPSMTGQKRFEELRNVKLKDLSEYISTGVFKQRDIFDADGNKINDQVNQYFDKRIDLLAQTEALGDLLFLDKSTEGQDPGFFRAAADSFIQSVTPENLVDKKLTQRGKLDIQQQILEETGIEITTGMAKAAVPDLVEDLGTGVGGSIVPLAEFAVINVATAGLGNAAAATRLGSKALSWYKNAKTSSNILEKSVYYGGQLALEEMKTQLVGLDTGSGVAFKGFHYLMPLQFRKYVAPGLERMGVGNRTANVIANVSDITFGSTVRAAGAMETAGLVEHIIKEGEASDYINENFQDLSQISRRMLVQGLSMSWLGGGALLKRRTYYGAEQFAKELQSIDAAIKETNDATKIERYTQAKQAIVAEMVSQKIAKDVANDKTFAEMAKSDILSNWPEVKKLVESNEIDLEVKITNNPGKSNGGQKAEIIDGRLKITVNVNKAEVVETAKTQDGQEVGVVKLTSTVGHEGYHANNSAKAYNKIKNNKKVTQEDLDIQRANEAYKSANQVLKNAEKIQKETGVDVLDIKRKVDDTYSDYTKGQKTEEFIAALRDNFYEKLTYKQSSIFQVKKLINNIKQTLNVKGDVKTANEFLEMLDRLSNKKGKDKFEQDVDVSTEAVAGAKMGIEGVREMEQRNLTEYEKLEKQRLEIELKRDSFEIDFDLAEQQIQNINFKLDRLSREGRPTRVARPAKQNTKQIGDDIKALVPEGTTKKEYDRKVIGEVGKELITGEMLDPLIRNIAAGYGIVSNNVYGKSWGDFFIAVKNEQFVRNLKKFNPELNNDFGGYVVGSQYGVRNRVKEALELFKKEQAETQGKDVAEAKGISYEGPEGDFETMDLSFSKRNKETEAEVSVYDRPTLKERGIINENNESIVQNAALKILKELENEKLFQDKSKNKRKLDILEEIDKRAKNLKEDLKLFKKSYDLENLYEGSNKDAILENFTTFFLGGKTTGDKVLGGMPFAIEKSVNGKFLPYPEWVGKKIDREKTSEGQAGRTSGNELVRRASPSSIQSIKAAFAKRGFDLSFNKQLFASSVSQEITQAINKKPVNIKEGSTQQKIANSFEKVVENNPDVTLQMAKGMWNETKVRVMEQRDLSLKDAIKLSNNENKIINESLGKTRKEVYSIIKGIIPDAKDTVIMQFATALTKGFSGLSRINILQQEKNINEKIKQNKELTAEEGAFREQRSKELQDILQNKIDKKAGKDQLFDKNGNITEAGENFINEGRKYLQGKNVDYQYFAAAYANPLRYTENTPYSSKDIVKIFPELKGKVKEKTVFGDRITLMYPGNIKVDLRYKDGKTAVIKSPGELKKYNNRSDKFQKNIIDLIKDPNKTEAEKMQKALELYTDNLGSAGSLASKITYIEVANGKAINLETAVAEHNSPRKQQLNQIKTWILNPNISKEIIKSEMNLWNLNFISKESNNLLTEAGLTSKGTNSQRMQVLLNANKAFTPATNVRSDGSLKNSNNVIGSLSPRVMEQRSLNTEFNNIIERSSGIGARKKLSAVVARRMGNRKNKFKIFLPPAAEDFRGLFYTMLGKGKQGEADKRFFQENLVFPYTRGIAAMEKSKQALANDYKTLNKVFRKTLKDAGIPKTNKNIPGADITIEQAMRIYLWSEAGFEIPELTKVDQRKAIEYVYKNPPVQAYAESLLAISKQEAWSKPTEYWDTGSVLSDLTDIALNVNRKQYLEKFIENKNEIFSTDNLNKLEAAYGRSFRESIEDIMYRMETGTNKSFGKDSVAAKWNNWVTNSVGAIMFFNRRSATLQLLSTANFMNTGDNNPLKAAAAFANQPQYWKDWTKIFNSDKLKERRGGLKSDVQEAEIAAAARDSKSKPQAILSYLLKIGFTPTKIADSFAIASGGAAFYRNRINTYKKQGLSEKEAEAKAWEDFSLISDATQQSGDPMLISKQQAGFAGRFILNFANTQAQMTRMQKRDFQDLINRRRIEGKNQFQSDATYLSRIGYYALIQNVAFNALQQGLFTFLPGFDNNDISELSEKELKKQQEKDDRKVFNVLNGMLDTTLRGAGVWTSVASVVKNTILEYNRQQKKDAFRKDNTKVLLQAFNVSPPIGSKASKLYRSLETLDYEDDVITARGFDIMNDGRFQLSPAYQVLGGLTAATTNLPLDRVFTEIDGLTEAFDSRNTLMQRTALGLGWKNWEVGAEIEEHELIKADAKETRKIEGKKKAAETRKKNKEKELARLAAMSEEERKAYLIEQKLKRSEAAAKAAETRAKNKRILDSLKTINYKPQKVKL